MSFTTLASEVVTASTAAGAGHSRRCTLRLNVVVVGTEFGKASSSSRSRNHPA